ncbi:MAG: OmpH family outer membrane protein [Rickettsiales bacterium]|nr:OmpH family outer membrane protein [Rickettsiales bacterium]
MKIKFTKSLLLLSIILFSFNARSEAVSPIVFIDVEYIVSETKAAQDVKEIIKLEVEKFQKNLKEKQEIIYKKEQELKAKANVLSSEKLKEEQTQIVKQFKEFELELANKKKSLDASYAEFINEIQVHIQKVVVELADENNYQTVITRNSLVYAKKSLDISDDVIALLNKRMPKIEFKVK